MRTIIVLISICLISTLHAQQVNFCDITGCIGDVKYSILDTSVFEANYPGWILLDGGNSPKRAAIFSTSKLHTLLNVPSLPDARGIFLRGANEGREPSIGNPDGDKPVGSYQNDLFAAHSHPFNYNFSRICGMESGSNITAGSNYGAPMVAPARGDDCALKIGNAGGAETRPRNIILYVYIKVN